MWAVCFGILFLSWNGKKSWDVQSLVFDHWQQICWLFVDCKSKDAVEQGKFKETSCLLFKRGTDFVHAIFAIGNSSILFDLWAYRALRDNMLHDDPNLFIDFWSSTRCLWNKLLANANQLLCRKYQRRFFFEEVTFDHVPGKEKDQVSPMFISEHQRKTSVCRFCKITQFFFFFFRNF